MSWHCRGVQCSWQATTRCDVGWRVRTAEGSEVIAQFVVDATGRGTRLRRWLAEIGVTTAEPLAVHAGLRNATQLIEGGPDPRDLPGVVLQVTPQSPAGGIALPVEG